MLNRQQRDELVASLQSVKELWEGAAGFSVVQNNVIMEALRVADDTCREGLSAVRYAFYQDIFSVLLETLQPRVWQELSQCERENSKQLCLEVLDCCIDALQKEREVKKEIVFLPYKASMWDSLESVWQSAYEDKEHCNTYVVPIPYADRNPDGSAAEWHCEADIFPEYVPVIDYRMISLSQLHPDIIFFHNPYDAYNMVTSVDGTYYSDKLKEVCDLLVYIPYFVSNHTVSASLCQTSGVVNADTVIVESEDIKKIYKDNYPGGNPPEDKFIAIGSPKYDAVLKYKREEYNLPKNWRRIVKGKKVVLYNTSLGSVLSASQYVCQKMLKIMEFFKQNKELALWWRPHPLMEATLHSMRPDIAAEYEAIKNRYKKEGWGIYDDTADLNRAIACSDAYFGDESSVAYLYQITQKPILIENYACLTRKLLINVCNFVEDEDGFYFVDSYRGVIFSLSESAGDIKFVGFVPRAYAKGFCSFASLDKVNGGYLILPGLANMIIKYNCQKKAFGEKISNTKMDRLSNWLFVDLIKDGDLHYYFSKDSCACLCYDERNDCWQHMTEYEVLATECLDKLKGAYNPAEIVLDTCRINNSIFILLPLENKLLSLALDSHKASVVSVGAQRCTYRSVTYDGRYLWLLAHNGSILIRWDMTLSTEKIYDINTILGKDTAYNKLLHHLGKIIIFPADNGNILYMDPATGLFEQGVAVEGKVWYAANLKNNGFAWLELGHHNNPLIDKQNVLGIVRDGRSIRYPLCGEALERYYSPQEYAYDGIYYENVSYTFDRIGKMIDCHKINELSKFNVGKKIYRYCIDKKRSNTIV